MKFDAALSAFGSIIKSTNKFSCDSNTKAVLADGAESLFYVNGC